MDNYTRFLLLLEAVEKDPEFQDLIQTKRDEGLAEIEKKYGLTRTDLEEARDIYVSIFGEETKARWFVWF